MDIHFIAYSPLAKEVRDEHCSLVRRARAFVWQRTDDYGDSPTRKRVQRLTQLGRTIKGEERLRGVCKVGDGFRRELGPECDNQIVVAQKARGGFYLVLSRLDGEYFGLYHLDAGPHQ